VPIRLGRFAIPGRFRSRVWTLISSGAVTNEAPSSDTLVARTLSPTVRAFANAPELPNSQPLNVLGNEFCPRAFPHKWLSSDAQRWSRTALILTYDEHDGFLDHVSPFRFKYRNSTYNVAFDSTGPRVPAIVAGPFAPLRVAKEPLGNTSILSLIAERIGNAGLMVSSRDIASFA
jgi:hypothetical protein